MKTKVNRKRIILVLFLTLTLCTGTWYGAFNSALLDSYAVSQEEKDQAQKEADEAKAAAEAKKKEAKEDERAPEKGPFLAACILEGRSRHSVGSVQSPPEEPEPELTDTR